MRPGSLRLRLLAGAGAFILVAVALSALGLAVLFKAHVEDWVDMELRADLDRIVAGLDLDADGKLAVVRPPDDPRFGRPFSGLYWEAKAEPGGPVLRSRSLWDFEIALAEQSVDDAVHHHLASGPAGQTLYVLQRRVELPARLGSRTVRAAVALDDAEVRNAVWRFAGALIPLLSLLALLLIAAAWIQVSFGLRPLGAMRDKLTAIGSGARQKLGSGFPDEVQPLADEFDALLDAREGQIEKARQRAADLAHGLKTPLQVLASDAARLRAKGEEEIAAEVEEISDVMRRLVERQLARARLAESGANVSADVRTCAVRVVRVIERTAAGERLEWEVDIAVGLAARIDPDDLTEVLGNLVENAARHARTRVVIAARAGTEGVAITVRDDGPGVPRTRHADIRQRGARLDTSGSGAGLGLAIVDDIAEAWGGSLALDTTPDGFCARLSVPPVDRAPP
jgi:signal transduction histidine kinase